MKRFPKDLVAALESALRAAREALDDLDDDDVPAALRRVVAHSGPRLTPPLAQRLLGELDRLEWLRADAADELDDDASAAARAFLTRPDGWWADVAAATADVRSVSLEADIETLRRRADQQRGDLTTLKSKMKQQKATTTAREAALRRELKAVRKELAAVEGSDDRRRERAEQRIAELAGDLAAARDDLDDATHQLVELRDRLRAQRRELASARRALRAGGSASVPRDPVTLARELDLVAASVPHRHTAASEKPGEVEQPTAVPPRRVVPMGVRPDRADAVEWLLGAGAVTVIVDGYNLLFHLEPGDYTSGRARRRLEGLLAQLVRKSGGHIAVRIVFDSSLPGGRDQRIGEEGVTVVFAEADRLADEEVVHLAAQTTGPVVVVSSDREVREQADFVGAATLWSEAFVEWFASG